MNRLPAVLTGLLLSSCSTVGEAGSTPPSPAIVTAAPKSCVPKSRPVPSFSLDVHVSAATPQEVLSLMWDPEYRAEEDRFRTAVADQLGEAYKAGGTCRLPARFKTGNDRLGDMLQQTVEARKRVLERNHPGNTSVIEWKAALGQAECEATPPLRFASDFNAPSSTQDLELLRGSYNGLCAELQGGDLGELHVDPLAADKLLAQRGESIFKALSPDQQADVKMQWIGACANGKKLDSSLSPIEWSAFLASDLLASTALEEAHWRCPVDVFMTDHNAWCGYSEVCRESGPVRMGFPTTLEQSPS